MMVGHIAPKDLALPSQYMERQDELEEALFDCLKVIHMTNVSKKSVADQARRVLGIPIGTRLPESYLHTPIT